MIKGWDLPLERVKERRREQKLDVVVLGSDGLQGANGTILPLVHSGSPDVLERLEDGGGLQIDRAS